MVGRLPSAVVAVAVAVVAADGKWKEKSTNKK